ncbi:MAG TPA: peptidoglycan-binding domain-containing protein [Edaphobacter sp.]
MFSGRLVSAALLLSLSLPSVAMTHTRRGPTSHSKPRPSSKSAKHTSGQRSIDDSRATEIQSALIHSGYLTGEPSGHWDAQTEAAMQKLQADNGWQTKLVPDSRAIIKLGLGPSHAQPAPGQTTSSLNRPASAFVSQR